MESRALSANELANRRPRRASDGGAKPFKNFVANSASRSRPALAGVSISPWALSRNDSIAKDRTRMKHRRGGLRIRYWLTFNDHHTVRSPSNPVLRLFAKSNFQLVAHNQPVVRGRAAARPHQLKITFGKHYSQSRVVSVFHRCFIRGSTACFR